MGLRSKSGFTLIEVMITIMIIGILATAGTPLLASSLERARNTEARAALGSIRRAMRMHYIEYGTYRDPQFLAGRKVTFGEILPLKDIDLEGRFFSSECYTFEKVKRRTFRIRCTGSVSEAPAGGEVAGIILYINQHGDIWTGGASDDGPTPLLTVARSDR